MILLLTCLSLFITCFYIMAISTGDFFKYIAGHLLGKVNRFYRNMSYLEMIFIVLSLFNCQRGDQSMIFTFILLGWLLSWAVLVPVHEITIDKRKGYLFMWITICIYAIITIININSTYIWIKTI